MKAYLKAVLTIPLFCALYTLLSFTAWMLNGFKNTLSDVMASEDMNNVGLICGFVLCLIILGLIPAPKTVVITPPTQMTSEECATAIRKKAEFAAQVAQKRADVLRRGHSMTSKGHVIPAEDPLATDLDYGTGDLPN